MSRRRRGGRGRRFSPRAHRLREIARRVGPLEAPDLAASLPAPWCRCPALPVLHGHAGDELPDGSPAPFDYDPRRHGELW